MNLKSFPASSKVWIYQGNKVVPENQLESTLDEIKKFANQWMSHDFHHHAIGEILHNRFVVFVVDESKIGVSGCSMDRVAQFIRNLGESLSINFFDRNRYTYLDGDDKKNVSAEELRLLYNEGLVSDESLIFDNLVNTKEDFVNAWIKPIKDTWIKRVVLS